MLLSIKSLSHTIFDGQQKREILSNVNFSLQQGESVALMGDSGSGKTTFLNLIAGLVSVQQGEIDIIGFPVHQATDAELSALRKNTLSIIFQQFNLLESLTVEDNIAFSARLAGRYDSEHCRELSEQLGLMHLLHKRPDEISGGEEQRVAIARSLAAKPALLLADEPTGNLDRKNSDQVVASLLDLARQQQTGLVMVTHSHVVAERVGQVQELVNGKLVSV